MSYSGIVNVYKEQGFTSFDVVAKMRGIYGTKKVGHTGTLDPMAEGVLLVCVGRATKLSDILTSGDKCYHAVMQLGISTDTEDISGEVLDSRDISSGDYDLSDEHIEEVIAGFRGKQKQVPPMYSAIKVKGKKLYEYARQGIEIERAPRDIEIYSLEITRIDIPYIEIDIKCSKGTYIRSLIRDVGEKLGTLATMTKLIRTEVGTHTVSEAYKLSDLQALKEEGRLDEAIISIDDYMSDVPGVIIKPESEKLLMNGNKLGLHNFISASEDGSEIDVKALKEAAYFKVYNGNELCALYRYDADKNIYMNFKTIRD